MPVEDPVKLVVKHTFLSFESEEGSCPRRRSDSNINYSSSPVEGAVDDGSSAYQQGQGMHSEIGKGSRPLNPNFYIFGENVSDASMGTCGKGFTGWGSEWPGPEAWRGEEWHSYGSGLPPWPPSQWSSSWGWSPQGPAHGYGYGVQTAAFQPDEGLPSDDLEERTTVMLQNLPEDYWRDMVVALLDRQGFKGLYDFVYVPMKFRTRLSFGYAFVNFISASVTRNCWDKMQGFVAWAVPSDKPCNLSWSVHQGLEVYIRRYRNSPIMHSSVLDEFKPAVFSKGVRVPFPAPTKKLRMPRIRNSHDDDDERPDDDEDEF
jgi:hypothetical protein